MIVCRQVRRKLASVWSKITHTVDDTHHTHVVFYQIFVLKNTQIDVSVWLCCNPLQIPGCTSRYTSQPSVWPQPVWRVSRYGGSPCIWPSKATKHDTTQIFGYWELSWTRKTSMQVFFYGNFSFIYLAVIADTGYRALHISHIRARDWWIW